MDEIKTEDLLKDNKAAPPEPEPNKALRILRNIVLSVIGLAVFFVSIALAYVYFTEPADVTPAAVPEEEQQDELQAFGEPSTPEPNAAVGVSIQALTSPVAPGSNASLSIKTLRDASCEIAVYSDEASENLVNDSGLTTKVANEYGVVDWAWSVDQTASEGEWPIEIQCFRNDQSGVLLPRLEIKQP